MTVTQIENVAGIVDPLSMSEFKLAVTSVQLSKALIFAFNTINALNNEVSALKVEIENLKAPTPTPAKAKTTRAKTASNQSGGTLDEGDSTEQ